VIFGDYGGAPGYAEFVARSMTKEGKRMFTGRFWRHTAERAAKTAAQTAVALVGAGAVDVLTVDWQQVGSVSAGAAIVSVLTSVASAGASGDDTPSLVR
jgi:hypothetical protein